MTSWRAVVFAAAAVLVALAIGVILGSGPLRTALTGQTAAESDALRAQVADLTSQYEQQQLSTEVYARALAELGPIATQGRLEGHAVAIVTTPDVTAAQIESATSTIESAGGTVVATASLRTGWFAEEQAAFRAAMAQQIATDVGGTEEGAAPEAVLHSALVQALLPAVAEAATEQEDGALPGPDPTVSRSEVLRELLARAELATVGETGNTLPAPQDEPTQAPEEGEADRPPTADLVVILVGDQALASAESGDPAPDAASLARLGAAFAASQKAVVVVTGPAHEGDVASAVDANTTQLRTVTVVTDAWGAAGPILLVLASEEQLDGGAGIYGDPARSRLVPAP